MASAAAPFTTNGNEITLAAFVAPSSAGTHTVQIRGGICGGLVDDAYGVSFIREDFTYTVVVA